MWAWKTGDVICRIGKSWGNFGRGWGSQSAKIAEVKKKKILDQGEEQIVSLFK